MQAQEQDEAVSATVLQGYLKGSQLCAHLDTQRLGDAPGPTLARVFFGIWEMFMVLLEPRSFLQRLGNTCGPATAWTLI